MSRPVFFVRVVLPGQVWDGDPHADEASAMRQFAALIRDYSAGKSEAEVYLFEDGVVRLEARFGGARALPPADPVEQRFRIRFWFWTLVTLGSLGFMTWAFLHAIGA